MKIYWRNATDDSSMDIMRSLKNKRKRPNAERRHDPSNAFSLTDDWYNSFNNTKVDFQWMSLNYRKMKAFKLSKSKKRMVLLMFSKGFHYFPTLGEIRDELV